MMHTLSALTIAAALTMFATACSNDDLFVEKQQSETPAAEAPVYHFSIPASFSSNGQTRGVEVGETAITSTFSYDDKVYVFIKRDLGSSSIVATAHNGTDASLYLTPTDIKGSSCTLDGALTFFTVENYQFVPFVPAEEDEVYLFYNFSNTTVGDPTFNTTGWDFTRQNGSINEDVYGDPEHTYLATQGISAFDCAEARMVVTKVIGNATDGYSLSMVQYGDETKSDVHFEHRQSLFRQRLKFTDEEGEPISVPTLERLSIYFEGGNYFVNSYTPFSQYGAFYNTSELTLDEPFISSDGDVYFSLMFTMDNIDKPLVLVARDKEGNVYSVTKEVPEGGFKNGKYYYGEASLTWKKTVKPKVSGTSATPFHGRYSIEEEDPVELELSGNSEDYYFRLAKNQGGIITLDNVHASGSLHQDLYSPFIYQESTENAQTISLVLTGANSIECHSFWAILVYGDLKLSCTGSEATLTVTTTSAECCGISCWNYRSDGQFNVSFNEFSTEGELNVTDMLAASGYKVIRSARTANDDNHDFYVDSYTWTYTVMPE